MNHCPIRSAVTRQDDDDGGCKSKYKMLAVWNAAAIYIFCLSVGAVLNLQKGSIAVIIMYGWCVSGQILIRFYPSPITVAHSPHNKPLNLRFSVFYVSFGWNDLLWLLTFCDLFVQIWHASWETSPWFVFVKKTDFMWHFHLVYSVWQTIQNIQFPVTEKKTRSKSSPVRCRPSALFLEKWWITSSLCWSN